MSRSNHTSKTTGRRGHWSCSHCSESAVARKLAQAPQIPERCGCCGLYGCDWHDYDYGVEYDWDDGYCQQCGYDYCTCPERSENIEPLTHKFPIAYETRTIWEELLEDPIRWVGR